MFEIRQKVQKTSDLPWREHTGGLTLHDDLHLFWGIREILAFAHEAPAVRRAHIELRVSNRFTWDVVEFESARDRQNLWVGKVLITCFCQLTIEQ